MEITKRPGLACIRGAPLRRVPGGAPGPQTLAHAAPGVLHRDVGNTQGLIVLLTVAVDERAENVLVPSDQF
jgi:hypothetical protein